MMTKILGLLAQLIVHAQAALVMWILGSKICLSPQTNVSICPLGFAHIVFWAKESQSNYTTVESLTDNLQV